MRSSSRRIFWILVVIFVVSAGLAILPARSGYSVDASKGVRVPAQEGWRLAQPVTYENLTIFPVVAPLNADTSEFATLDEALASGDVIVTEEGEYLRRSRGEGLPSNFSSGAQVNQLVLINRGKKPLVLLAGELVSGGKQDRIIGKDRIVPVGAAPLPLDVFCVEHDRWTGGSANFSAAKMMTRPSVREKAAVEQDQYQVWAAVRGEADSVGSNVAGAVAGAPPPQVSQRALSEAIAGAGTQSYQKIYQSSPIGVSVENFAGEIERRFDRARGELKSQHVVGVVVAFGGEVAWSDIFASSEMFDTYWPKLLRSYAVEALTRPASREKVSLSDANDFMRPATGHVEEESEPGIYIWRKQSEGRISEIELDAVAPKPITLHWLRVLRAD